MERALNISMMKYIIYMRLLDEGTDVFRPVPALELGNSIYKIEGYDIYNPEDEVWEFPPGSYVVVEEQLREGTSVLIAVKSGGVLE